MPSILNRRRIKTQLAAYLAFLLLCAPAWADIFHTDSPGLTLYARVRTSATASFAVALTEGTSNAVGYYTVSDSAILTAAGGTLAANAFPGYTYKVFTGTPSASANDPLRGYGMLPWSGTVELPPSGNALYWASMATAADDIALLAQLAAINFATDSITSDEIAASAVIEIGVGGGGAADPTWVDSDHSWTFDNRNQTTAANTIAENLRFDALVAMEPEIHPRVALLNVGAVSVTPATAGAVVAPTLGSATIQTNKRRINVPIDATLATAGTFTISITFTTTDNQTFVRKGRISFE